MDENYGTGPEKYVQCELQLPMGSAGGGRNPVTGMATLDLHQGSAINTRQKLQSCPWAGGGADVTIEWKIAFHGGASANVFLAKTRPRGVAAILSLDRDFVAGYQATNLRTTISPRWRQPGSDRF